MEPHNRQKLNEIKSGDEEARDGERTKTFGEKKNIDNNSKNNNNNDNNNSSIACFFYKFQAQIFNLQSMETVFYI